MCPRAPASTVLQLDARRTLLREAGDGRNLLAMPIGWEDLATAFRSPVSSDDIELAIDLVEDAIGHPRLDITPVLHVRSDEVRLLGEAAGATGPDMTLTAEAVEGLFTRLARQAAGALSIADRLPEDARFAATLVLVRELMHHLGVSTLKIGPA
jgi:hypothetical protein